jgi:hypothetical protein
LPIGAYGYTQMLFTKLRVNMSKITVPSPELQTDFAKTLFTIRGLYLQDALRKVIEKTDIETIENELHKFAPKQVLTALAAIGLSGEFAFATPYLLKKSPYLLGYYRLLLGFSQKAFYVKRFNSLGSRNF